jgi:tetratricopeptide (TPR) repeat protein
MIPRISTDDEWLRWIEVQKSATHTWFDGDLHGAIEIIDQFVASNPPIDLRRQAIGFRGSIYQEQGDLVKAMNDFLAARSLTEMPDFERYTLEESAAAVSYELGDTAGAERWYLEALKTAAADARSSGASVILHLAKIRGDAGLTVEERLLAETVIKQAWDLHKLPGSPDLHDILAATRTVIQAQSTSKRSE